MPGDGLVIVDKPAGCTSHDVVGRVRRLAHMRRVGHAGTLDPMATGVLVVGIGRATRLLGHLALAEKAYDATIRLGVSTVTDDAEGEVSASRPVESVTDAGIMAGVAALTGPIQQVPSAVSAVKIKGERAYARVRAGEEVELAARPVTIQRFDITAIRRVADVVDVDASVVCSAGTYVRALARDLGAALGVGGHLTRLRRTRVGPYQVEDARTLDQLEDDLVVTPIAEVAAAAFARRTVTDDEAARLSHGGWLPTAGIPGTYAAFGPNGQFLALVEEEHGAARPVAVFSAR